MEYLTLKEEMQLKDKIINEVFEDFEAKELSEYQKKVVSIAMSRYYLEKIKLENGTQEDN